MSLSDHPALSDPINFNRWHQALITANVRGVILGHDLDQFKRLLVSSPLSNQDQLTLETVKPSKVSDWLGTERSVYLLDARTDFDPNQFAAICGSLVGGGLLLILLTEALLKTCVTLQAEQKSWDRTAYSKYAISPLLSLLLEKLLKINALALLSSDQFILSPILNPDSLNTLPGQGQARAVFSQQAQLVEKIIRVAKGHANRPLVITAPRGRGKSTALAMAAQRLVESTDHPIQLIVTAAKIENLASFFDYLRRHGENNQQKKQGKIKKCSLHNGSEILYLPFDQLLEQGRSLQPSLVMVDEAAAIPTHVLDKISVSFNRLVFATTNDGYEGNGRGFEVRFKKKLLKSKPNTHFATLTQPIRWSKKDELETACNSALLLESGQIKPVLDQKFIQTGPLDTASLNFEILPAKKLMQDESLLQKVFGLLVNAHYQTRPSDLNAILSNPAIQVAALFLVDRQQADEPAELACIALVMREGGLPQTLCESIYLGQKRLKGELLPQSLMLHSAMKLAGTFRFARIMRIATQAELRNQGIGSVMLKKLADYYQSQYFDFIGSSFAASKTVVSFWLANQFSPIRIGHKRDAASGEFSLEVLQTLNQSAEQAITCSIQRFKNSFLYRSSGAYDCQDIDWLAGVVVWIYGDTQETLTPEQVQELSLFVDGKRGYPQVDDWLLQLLQIKIADGTIRQFDAEITGFLIAIIILRIDFKIVAQNFDLKGKNQVSNRLKEQIKKLLENA